MAGSTDQDFVSLCSQEQPHSLMKMPTPGSTWGFTLHCVVCKKTFKRESSVPFRCFACKESFVLDKTTTDECFIHRIFCLSCTRKLHLVLAARNQILCEG